MFPPPSPSQSPLNLTGHTQNLKVPQPPNFEPLNPPVAAATPPHSPPGALASPAPTPLQTPQSQPPTTPGGTSHPPLPAYALPPPIVHYHPNLPPISTIQLNYHHAAIHPHGHSPYAYTNYPPISPSLAPHPQYSPVLGMVPTTPPAVSSPGSSQSTTPRFERILPKQDPPFAHLPPPAQPLTPSALTQQQSPQQRGHPSQSPHYATTSPNLLISPHHHPLSMLPPSMISVSPSVVPTTTSEFPLKSSQGTTADQREIARKVSHSAIERRRRERINDKIIQLKRLIPSCAGQDHLHKLNILQSAIDYIQYLQEATGNRHTNGIKNEPIDLDSYRGQLSQTSPTSRPVSMSIHTQTISSPPSTFTAPHSSSSSSSSSSTQSRQSTSQSNQSIPHLSQSKSRTASPTLSSSSSPSISPQPSEITDGLTLLSEVLSARERGEDWSAPPTSTTSAPIVGSRSGTPISVKDMLKGSPGTKERDTKRDKDKDEKGAGGEMKVKNLLCQ